MTVLTVAVVSYLPGKANAGCEDMPDDGNVVPVNVPARVMAAPLVHDKDTVDTEKTKRSAAPQVSEESRRQLHRELEQLERKRREAEFDRAAGGDGYGRRIGRHLSETSY